MLLAFVGGWIVKGGDLAAFVASSDLGRALLAGVLAVPLAPIAKDLSSALAAAVNALQAGKK